jgi:hypothetical protein
VLVQRTIEHRPVQHVVGGGVEPAPQGRPDQLAGGLETLGARLGIERLEAGPGVVVLAGQQRGDGAEVERQRVEAGVAGRVGLLDGRLEVGERLVGVGEVDQGVVVGARVAPAASPASSATAWAADPASNIPRASPRP